MVLSNKVTIHVRAEREKLKVTDVAISPEKTSVKTETPVPVRVKVTLNRAPTQDEADKYAVLADIYVNGAKRETGVIVARLQPGSKTARGGFDLVFPDPGDYEVQIDAYLGGG